MFAACARMQAYDLLTRNKLVGSNSWVDAKIPIVYNDIYNITFMGLEKLHPFDSTKYRHVAHLLQKQHIISSVTDLVQAPNAEPLLSTIHSPEYLNKLHSSSFKIAQVTELAPLAVLPTFLLRRNVLKPMAYMAGGSVIAGALALRFGWAINLGGGMHHAHYNDGGGWCAYDDITLTMHQLRKGGLIHKIMIIDLDIHQGNGHERSKLHWSDTASDTFIVDVYNSDIYPLDRQAKRAIDVGVELHCGTGDVEYLAAVEGALEQAFKRCGSNKPDLIIYNAGTDILQGDPLGLLNISEQGIIQRDEMVFAAALKHKIPIVMLLSGGYTKASTPCIANSITNLVHKFQLLDDTVPAASDGSRSSIKQDEL